MNQAVQFKSQQGSCSVVCGSWPSNSSDPMKCVPYFLWKCGVARLGNRCWQLAKLHIPNTEMFFFCYLWKTDRYGEAEGRHLLGLGWGGEKQKRQQEGGKKHVCFWHQSASFLLFGQSNTKEWGKTHKNIPFISECSLKTKRKRKKQQLRIKPKPRRYSLRLCV